MCCVIEIEQDGSVYRLLRLRERKRLTAGICIGKQQQHQQQHQQQQQRQRHRQVFAKRKKQESEEKMAWMVMKFSVLREPHYYSTLALTHIHWPITVQMIVFHMNIFIYINVHASSPIHLFRSSSNSIS